MFPNKAGRLQRCLSVQGILMVEELKLMFTSSFLLHNLFLNIHEDDTSVSAAGITRSEGVALLFRNTVRLTILSSQTLLSILSGKLKLATHSCLCNTSICLFVAVNSVICISSSDRIKLFELYGLLLQFSHVSKSQYTP